MATVLIPLRETILFGLSRESGVDHEYLVLIPLRETILFGPALMSVVNMMFNVLIPLRETILFGPSEWERGGGAGLRLNPS